MEDSQTVPSTPVPPPPTAAGTSGLADNVAGALAYITIIPAILFLVLPDYNKRSFVRFHAFQCICLVVCTFVGIIPILGWIIDLALLVCWIIAIIKAYGGERWKVPVLGNFAEKFASQ